MRKEGLLILESQNLVKMICYLSHPFIWFNVTSYFFFTSEIICEEAV
jgi:hypothetical protein